MAMPNHPRHPVHDVIGCDNSSRSQVYRAEHVRGTSNEPTDLVRGDIRRRSARIDQLGTIEIPVPLLEIQMRVDVVERHDAIGMSHQSAVDSID
jgi:hypothetical protein